MQKKKKTLSLRLDKLISHLQEATLGHFPLRDSYPQDNFLSSVPRSILLESMRTGQGGDSEGYLQKI